MKRITLSVRETQLVKDFRAMTAFDRKTMLVVAHALKPRVYQAPGPAKDHVEQIAPRRAGA